MTAWRSRIELLPMAPKAPAGRLVVLAAHPDDEVVAIGAWLATQQRDREMVFVTATDGEASHPDSRTTTRDQLRARRPRELHAALAALGITQPEVHRLALPDGHLADDPTGLVDAITPWVDGAALVLAPFEHDGHPDHDALGAAALVACGGQTPVWRFPIWTWSWTSPAEQPWLTDARRLSDTPVSRTAKWAAVHAFTSQVEPLSDDPADAAVVTSTLLEHALHAPEVVLT